MTDRSRMPNRGQGDSTRPRPPKPRFDTAVLKRIVTDPNAAHEMVQVADQLGSHLKEEGLSTSQIRALFTEVRQIEADWQHNPERAHRRLILLKPKMKYRVGKQTDKAKQPVETLVNVLEPCVDEVAGDSDNFRRFVEFFEAILAYHKAYGGK